MEKVNFKKTIILLLVAEMVTVFGGGILAQQRSSVPQRHITTVKQEEPLIKDAVIRKEGGISPAYLGGDITQYINDNVHFPAEALNRSSNSVVIAFVVEKDGSLTNFHLFAGSYPALDAEVLRVAKLMPKWQPGKLADGKIVRIVYWLSGAYKLEDGKVKWISAPPPPYTYKPNNTPESFDKLPKFPGGVQAMQKFISDNIHYPAEALKYKEEGNITVQFIVQPTGEITDVTSLRCSLNDKCTLSSSLSKEAVRIVQLMPNWIPGEKKGKKVAVKYSLPITFKLP